jgi:hypothetical protein
MKKRYFTKKDEGVAGVIEALLMVALVAVVISTIQLVYIPQVMSQREADHMDVVANQFSSLKAMIDLQSVTQKDVPISSPITLGSRELPYFVTARALGELRIVNDANYKINVTNETKTLILNLTAVKYTAYNSYYLDGTMAYYIFQGGAIIRKQFDGETAIVEPSITVENLSDSINIHYNIPIIMGIEGKNTSPTDYKTCFIRTNYSIKSDDEYKPYPTVSSIVITTEYPTAWNESLHDLLGNNVNINKGSNYVEITRNVKQINLYYKEIYIYAQISPGWIE